MKILKNKKAISIMIGYVLLISFAIFMSIGVYTWMKTYVPKDIPNCPDSVSIFLEDFNCSGGDLTIDLKNNGRFAIGGYNIYASNKTNYTLSTINLAKRLTAGGDNRTNSVIFADGQNLFSTGDSKRSIFNITGFGTLTSIEITPIRFEEANNRKNTANCGKSKIREELNCQ